MPRHADTEFKRPRERANDPVGREYHAADIVETQTGKSGARKFYVHYVDFNKRQGLTLVPIPVQLELTSPRSAQLKLTLSSL